MGSRPGARRLLTSGRAAELLGISQATVLRAVRDGQLMPALVTDGGHYRFSEATLRAWADAHGQGPARGGVLEGNFQLFGSEGLASRLRVSPATIVRAVKRGVITPTLITPGGHYRFSPGDVAAAAAALAALG